MDEEAYSRIGRLHPQYMLAQEMRDPMCKMGAPFHFYLASDFDRIDWAGEAYRAVLILIPGEGAFAERARDVLKTHGVAGLYLTEFREASWLRDFLEDQGVFIYSRSEDVLYAGNGYVALHADSAGEKIIRLPEKTRCIDTVTSEKQETDRICFSCEQYETRIFRLEQILQDQET